MKNNAVGEFQLFVLMGNLFTKCPLLIFGLCTRIVSFKFLPTGICVLHLVKHNRFILKKEAHSRALLIIRMILLLNIMTE